MPMEGIDISEFNGDVNIAAMKGKIDFVIIRCGYGGNYSYQDDKRYRENVRKCQAAGIPFGVYLYSYARNRAMALDEAEHALRLLEGLTPLYGVWYDLEDRTLPGNEKLTENCLAFYGRLTQAGYYCGLYSSISWMLDRLSSPRLAHIDRWVAQWTGELQYPGAGIWQYTDRGLINGRYFDRDRAFRDYPDIIRGEDWTDMTREQVREIAREEAQRVYDSNEGKYKFLRDVPAWAREAVEDVYRRLELSGTGSEDDVRLDAGDTYVRALFVIDRVLELIDELTRPEGAAAAAAEDTADAAEEPES